MNSLYIMIMAICFALVWEASYRIPAAMRTRQREEERMHVIAMRRGA